MKSFRRTISLARRGVQNYFQKRPFCVSFEITYSCNARCQHCHLHGIIKDEVRATPQRFGEICREIKPVVAQVSGGEPLLRRDLEEIIQNLRVENRAPFVVVTTNGALLSKKRYARLREAGVDEFSLSLDFPDERHDDFRGIPGLFARLEKLAYELDGTADKAITLSCVVQRKNFRDLPQMAELAQQWNLRINFSTYTWLRTQDKGLMLSRDDLPEFDAVVAELLEMRKRNHNFFASPYIFHRMRKFFENETIPGCLAGEKFFVVNPDGTFSPCGLIIKNYPHFREIQTDFLPANTCGECNTSIRANTEKPVGFMIKDNLRTLFSGN